MNHLLRDLAPVTDRAWEAIDNEATRSLKHYLAARRLIDFEGPHGWEHSAVDLGRVRPLGKGPIEGVSAVRRSVLPLVELPRRSSSHAPSSRPPTGARMTSISIR